MLTSGEPIQLVNENYRKSHKGTRIPSTAPFLIDPSVFPHENKHKDFVQYMISKSL